MANYTYAAETEPMPKEVVLRTDRSALKVILLNIITLGIYSIVFFISVSFDINKIATVHDAKKTTNYVFAYLLSIFTLNIVMDFWQYQVSGRIGDELKRREINYKFGTGTFWKWFVFGSFIIVGPFVYLAKFCKAMNLLCEDYNKNK